jgi:hypothetical protein
MSVVESENILVLMQIDLLASLQRVIFCDDSMNYPAALTSTPVTFASQVKPLSKYRS